MGCKMPYLIIGGAKCQRRAFGGCKVTILSSPPVDCSSNHRLQPLESIPATRFPCSSFSTIQKPFRQPAFTPIKRRYCYEPVVDFYAEPVTTAQGNERSMFGKPGGPPRRPLMAAIHSLSSLLQNPRHLHSTNPNPTFQFSSPTPRAFWRCARDNGERDTTLPPPSPLKAVKRSLAVATGELFLGLASVLLRKRSSSSGGAAVLSGIDETRYSGSGSKVASVVEEPVIWEQRPEDLEAERERRKVTSPGFSFSAAGLLFPYHLGVAQLLLEKGFIKETTPLAGSSAGAIVCVVISSGSSMKDALQATRILAEDCRLNGTAFRLGLL